jgi:hypothetical protein
MQQPGEPSRETAAPEPPAPGLVADIGQLGAALRHLFGAQLHLLAAELGLARSAVSWMLLAALAATVAGVGLGLSVLAFVGLLLAKWFGSWLLALLVLCTLQLVCLFGAIMLFRRCMHWVSLPVTRNEWGAMVRQTLRRAEHRTDAGRTAASEEQQP